MLNKERFLAEAVEYRKALTANAAPSEDDDDDSDCESRPRKKTKTSKGKAKAAPRPRGNGKIGFWHAVDCVMNKRKQSWGHNLSQGEWVP